MHLRLLSLIGLVLASGLHVQAQNSDDRDAPKRSREELADLLGPIALYPDPLISLILPASTVPGDVVLAARFVKAGSDPEEAEGKPWDSSVKALVRYPDTLSWLDENLEWTSQVGEAFVDQPVDVMEAIQELRAKARDMGNLVDTPQQRIVQDDSAIRIVPAEPEYIYEPSYDPQVVYYQRPVAEPQLYFGAPLIVGRWLGYDFDWHRHRLYRGDWHSGWDYHREYDRDRDRDNDRDRGRREDVFVNNRLTNVQAWQVDAKRHTAQVRKAQPSGRPSGERVRPAVIVKPTPLANHIKHGDGRRGDDRGEMVRRGEPVGDSKFDHRNDGPGKPGEKDRKGKVITPRTLPPSINGDGRRGNDDHKGMVDRNGDGRPDVIKPKGNDDRKSMIDRNGDGRPDVVKPKVNDDHKGMIDRNGDGRPDVVKPKVNDDHKSMIDRNGDGRPDVSKPKGNDGHKSMTDRNGDGRPDVVKPKGNDGHKSVTDRNGDGRPDVSKPKVAAPHVEAPKAKSDNPKPKVDAPRPHVEAAKPKNNPPPAPKPHVDTPKPSPKPQPQGGGGGGGKPHSDGDGKKKDKDKKN